MKTGKYVVLFLLVLFSLPMVRAQNVEIELQMPSQMFLPGETFWLDLHILNHGPDYPDAQLFIAFNLGTDDYWFYPSWCHFPGEIDNEIISISANEDSVKSIIPEFEWPHDAGEFVDARFLSVLIYEDDLISNLAQITFGWTVLEKFIYIPPGTFEMGSPHGEICREGDEDPIHTVTITHGFYMQATEVTQQQWMNIFGRNPSYHENCMDCPVELVTWYDCCIYCNRLSVKEGLEPCYYSDADYTTIFDGIPTVTCGPVYWKRDADGYRLPTEAEWEYACRAGTTTAYNNGRDNLACSGVDPILDVLGWYEMNSNTGNGRESHPVGLKQPNAWGLYDMHGNGFEWCWDWYDYHYYQTSPSADPAGPESGSYRMIRGGCWRQCADYCRSAARNHEIPSFPSFFVSFRPIRSAQ